MFGPLQRSNHRKFVRQFENERDASPGRHDSLVQFDRTPAVSGIGDHRTQAVLEPFPANAERR